MVELVKFERERALTASKVGGSLESEYTVPPAKVAW